MIAGGSPELEEELRKLRLDFDYFKQEAEKRMRGHEVELDQKATKRELEELEARILEKMQELMNNLINLFADKE